MFSFRLLFMRTALFTFKMRAMIQETVIMEYVKRG